MTDKSKKLAELAALCEAATAPDREMDAMIHFVIKDGIGVGYASDAPAFTASLDAALTLVPDGWIVAAFRQWIIGDRRLAWQADISEINRSPGRYVYSGAPSDEVKPTSGPLALCAVALRARATMNAEER